MGRRMAFSAFTRPWVAVLAPTIAFGSLAVGCASAKNSHPNSSSTTSEDNLSGPGAPTPPGSAVAPDTGSTPGPSSCRSGNPLANVYHPNRLTVIQACTTVTGIVESVRSEDDGDTHFDLAVDPPYSHLLTSANMAHQHGWLVAEIVPADEPGCTPGRPPKPATGTYDYGICTGAAEVAPAIGSHVSVTGPYVIDQDHGGWAEVHPAWAVSSTMAGALPGSGPTAPPPAQPASPPEAAPAPGTSPWCQAAASPSNNGYSGDYDVHVHSNQPGKEATASDAGDTWHHETDSSGDADVRLYHTSPGEPISVTVGAASCSTTA